MLPKRVKKRINLKGLLGAIAAILFDVALSVLSFCIYFLVKPRNTAGVSVLCAVDFLYAVCHLIWLLKPQNKNWALKSILWPMGYIAAFIAFASLICVSSASFAFLKSHFIQIVFFAFFTSPSIIFTVALVLLIVFWGFGG